jgi:hypothetical protein
MKLQKLLDLVSSYPNLVKRVGHLLPQVRLYYLGQSILQTASEDKSVDTKNERMIVDMPFRVIAMESEGLLFDLSASAGRPDDEKSGVSSFILVEHGPNEIDVIMLFEMGKHAILKVDTFDGKDTGTYISGKKARSLGVGPDGQNLDAMFVVTTRTIAMHALAAKNRTLEAISKRKLRVKTAEGLDFAKVSSIIRVYGKKESDLLPAFGGHIDYTHRFEVEGHWRVVSGVGKDREGVYQVAGRTWVVPHTRGPEDAPLIPKIRVLMDGGQHE